MAADLEHDLAVESTGIERQASDVSCASVATQSTEAGTDTSDAGTQSERCTAQLSRKHKVRFRSSASIITDFTPYSDIYGVHPSEFCFDADGSMLRRRKARTESSRDDLLCVDFGSTLECVAPGGVRYVKRPNCDVPRPDMWTLDEGDRIEVLERQGAYVRDSVGWLPLITQDVPLFAIFRLGTSSW